MARKSKLTADEQRERDEYSQWRAENPQPVGDDYFEYDGAGVYRDEETADQRKERERQERAERRQARKERLEKAGSTSADDDSATIDVVPLVSPSEWEDSDVPKREWYWEDFFPARQVAILTAEGGVGKSLICTQLAAASALGQREVFGKQIMPGPVIYLGAEDDIDEFKRRLDAIAKHFGVRRSDISDLHLIPMAGENALLMTNNLKTGRMEPTPLWESLVDAVKRIQPVAVYLDTAADLFGGDEIKRAQVRQFISQLRNLSMTESCATILLYHPSRSGIESGKGESGSTAWQNSVRAAVYMTYDESAGDEVRMLKNTKTNYSKKGKNIQVEWNKGCFRVFDENAPPTPEKLKKWAEVETEFMSRLMDYLSVSSNQSINDKPRGNYAPTTLLKMRDTTYTRSDFVQAMQRLLVNERIELEPAKDARGRDTTRLVVKSRATDRKYGDDK